MCDINVLIICMISYLIVSDSTYDILLYIALLSVLNAMSGHLVIYNGHLVIYNGHLVINHKIAIQRI